MTLFSEHDTRVADTQTPAPSVSPVLVQGAVDPYYTRGGSGPNGKTSLTTDEAAEQITRDGYTLNGQNVTDTPVNITYAYRATYGSAMPSSTAGFSTFSAAQIAATDLALAAWADVANVTFTRVGTGDSGPAAFSDNATMLFGNYSTGMEGAAAFAYYPVDNSASNIYSSDVWVNNSFSYNANPALLNYGQQVLVHEIGHALGLQHPGDYNAGAGGDINYNDSATYYEDSRQYSLMSYWGESNTGAEFYGNYSSAPLLDDIAAIQRLYGANMTTRTGNTVYGFNSNADQPWFKASGTYGAVIFAVWDAGGIDTFDFSGYTSNSLIDLRAEHFSSVGQLIGNVSIAKGVIIENAIGGYGNDTIIGNDANNILEGGGGDDSLDGGAGTDTASYAHANHWVTVNLSVSWSQYVGGDQGTDTLVNIENLIGSSYDDILIGNSGNNRLDGGAGSDYAGWYSALAGVTVSLAITGAQSVGGGEGTDTLVNIENLLGSNYNDSLTGNAADNILEGAGGNDILNGGAGSDTAAYLFSYGVTVDLSKAGAQDVGGGAGTDTLVSIENLVSSNGDDTLTGNAGNNILDGAGGTDILNGGAGYDTVSYRNTNVGVSVNLSLTGSQIIGPYLDYDTLISIENIIGSDFNDTFFGNSDNNILDGSAGIDTVDYNQATSGVTVNLGLAGAQAVGGGQGSDKLISIENVNGSLYNDTLTGSSGDNIFMGGAGNDTINGAGGFDTVNYIQSAIGVTVDLSILTAQIVGDQGSDTLSNIEALVGSGFNDVLTGDGGNNTFTGGTGDDVINGGAGIDTVTFGNVNEGVTVNLTLTTAQTISYGLGKDTLSGIENIVGTAYNDTLTGIAATTYIDGGFGNDTITLSGKIAASARIDGGGGSDTIWLDGDYSSGLTLNATTLTNFETLNFKAGNSYKITLNDANAVAGNEVTISASTLGASNSLNLDASAETNATLLITGGAGVDTIKAGQYNDHIFMYDDLTAADTINGGGGFDWLYLIGNYASGLTFAATTMQNVESLYFAQGASYNVTLNDGNIAAGAQLQIYGADLGISDVLTVDGSAETNGAFYFYTQYGINNLKGGAQADFFDINGYAGALSGGGGDDLFFLHAGLFGNEVIQGGAGYDGVNLSYNGSPIVVEMNATTMTGIEDFVIANSAATITTHEATVAAGAQMYFNSNRSLTFNGSAETDGTFLINASDEADVILTGAGADQLWGMGGNDVLNGGKGADYMWGGAGDDTYYVDNAGDIVNEEQGVLGDDSTLHDGGGTETVNSSINYTLTKYIENLVLTGTALTATGNALSNVLTGNSRSNVLNGGGGADNLIGGLGNDSYLVDNVGDTVTELNGGGTDLVSSSVTYALGLQYIENLTLTGSANINASGNSLSNILTGNSGNNTLNGGSGADSMVGGLGNDSYLVDNVGDTVTELNGGGTDLVSSSVTYALGLQYIENLTLTGSANINASGNSLSNILTGNSGNNTLNGGSGADSMVGGLGNDSYLVDNVSDTVTELNGGGTDLVSSSVTYALGLQYIENLTLTGSANINASGNSLSNILTGNSGNNTLNGGSGADSMIGGLGNDTYFVDNAGDTVTEANGGGTDLVSSSVTFSLGSQYIENLTLTGTANINGSGNALSNTLTGNSGNNTLSGGGGNDTLIGGLGSDIFFFGFGSGADKINDFSASQNDTLNLHAYNQATAVFTQVGADTVIDLGGGNIITVLNTQKNDVLSHVTW